MNILHIIHQYPPANVGGTELYTQSVAQAMAQRGHQVSVLYRASAEGSGVERIEENGVSVFKVWSALQSPGRSFRSTLGDPRMERICEGVLDQVRPELVHVQHLMGLPAALVDSMRQRNLPFLITLHDYWWICANAQLLTNYSRQLCEGPRAYLNCARCALVRSAQGKAQAGFESSLLWPVVPPVAILLAWHGRLRRSAMLGARKLIAPSRFVANWYSTHGAPADRVEVLFHGLEWPDQRRQTLNGPHPLRLAYVGGLAWQKGIHVLVAALAGVQGAVELDIAGEGGVDPEYVAALKSQAPNNVRFLGQLSREQVWELLGRVDAVVIPSLWNETFSLIAHEALAAGVPVVASGIGALHEAVRDGVDGLLLRPGDVSDWQVGLQRLVDEPGLLAHLRSNVRPPMALGEHVRKLEQIYQGCLSR